MTCDRRTSKTVNGKTTEFIWQGSKLIAETDNDKHWQSYIYEPDSFRPLALIKGNAQQDKIQRYWYQNDQLGTPIRLTDSIGETLYQCEYNAYGQLIDENYYCDNIDTLPDNPLRFQGQYYDEETGLHYNLNRYYDPFIGRYITQDPLGLISNFNFYQYCSDPVNEIDPLGLISGLNNKTQNPWNAFQKAHKGQFADVKEAANAYAKLKAEQSPWPIGFTPIEREIQVGERFYMALSDLQDASLPGRFATFDNIPNVNFVRNDLAVKKAWKGDVSKVVEYEVIKSFKILEGPVGPQIDGSKYLYGGGNQLQLLLKRDVDAMIYIKPISIKRIQ